ncbi:SCO family protein [Hymenobacter lapidiphilus]|uniref:SCO family protein n=1 Tax=Hymenobacter lapidiphilus TaxID=2608003 RepID=A0A7Y7PPP2_9BACT|nr:SCO family protein [Hymenobacter lapidiphilus]NVO31720.1 SCO family protein [Hymenobacter lapidiphilus]
MTNSFRRAGLLLAAAGAALSLSLGGCSSEPNSSVERLPVLGFKSAEPTSPSDTLPDPIPAFRLTNQDRQVITNQTFAGKVYVTDFFFATCPSICPKMQSELLRVYKAFETNPDVLFLSHTIDPAHDSIPVLRDYAERLGINDASRWHFATAGRDSVFALAKAYMTGAEVDAAVPGGFAHSGTFALVDSQRRVRGVYDGMVPEQVDQLIKDIPVLLKEEAEAQPVAAK